MTILDQEAEFFPHELFFSLTDKKGIILGGNDVFVRISEYTEEELFQKPHNTIRHPDMPKTIFRLFWRYIKNDEPIVAYVKNRTKSGKYYWVLALAFPIPDGYLSVRLKPNPENVKMISGLYKKIKEYESTHADLDANIDWFLDQLKTMGYASYTEFMHYILPNELCARTELLTTTHHLKNEESNFSSDTYEDINKLLSTIKQIETDNENLVSAFIEVNLITKNLLIASAHLGKKARTLTTIAGNLQALMKEVQQGSDSFQKEFKKLVCSDQLMWCMAVIHFLTELYHVRKKPHNIKFVSMKDIEECCIYIQDLIRQYIKSTQDLLINIDTHYVELISSIADFVRISLGMNVTCVSGKIEIAHLSTEKDITDVQEQLADLKVQNDIIKEALKSISEQLKNIEQISYSLGKVTMKLDQEYKNDFQK